MSHKANIRIFCLIIVSTFGCFSAFADNDIRCELITCPRDWKISPTEQSGKILLAWEVSNTGKKAIRFRIRDLGKINLIDSDKKIVNPTMLGVDATKAFQEGDYPLIMPNETLYFPFAISFRRQENNLYYLKIRNHPDGDEGWFFANLKNGKYSVVGKYSTIKNSDYDGGFMWEKELKYLKTRSMSEFWKGEIISKPIEIILGDLDHK